MMAKRRCLRETTKRVVRQIGGHRCFWCGRERGPQYCNPYDTCEHEHHHDIAIDHVIPVSRGGTDDPWNLVIACVPCNNGRNNKTVEEYHGRSTYEVIEYLRQRCAELGVGV